MTKTSGAGLSSEGFGTGASSADEDFNLAYDEPETLSGSPLIREAKRRWNRCKDWEADWRPRFIEDIKFANADSDNGYQWPNSLRRNRDNDSRPCLTMNIIRQHNLQIINAGKQSPSQVDIRPTGNGATAKAAQMFQAVVSHIQYQSEAQDAYAMAREFQVDGGLGYWRVVTEWERDSMDLELRVAGVQDPLSVYMDPDMRERSGSDAKFSFVFDTVPKDEWAEAYPKFAGAGGVAPIGATGADDDWVTKDHVRVCEYFRKVAKPSKVVSFIDPVTGVRKTTTSRKIHPRHLARLVDDPETRIREQFEDVVEWYLIVGDAVVDQTIWPGSLIPIIRCLGTETVIDGKLDRRGHTRWMKDAQRMFNYNASGQVEFGALQAKAPWVAPAKAIEEYEVYWRTANTQNHSVLPYNHVDDDGNTPIPPPMRTDPPQASPLYEAGMSTAFNQMMMTSGQWQNQMGMGGNERTGEAIEKRQDQGDTATYHFRFNFESALVFTGRILAECIPRVYDTKRVLRLQSDDGTDYELEIDPTQREAFLEELGEDRRIVKRVFNPAVGKYDVRAQAGQAFGSRREETVKALTLILTQAPALTGVIGDLLLRAMDFKEAQEAAERLHRMVPPQALGTGPSQVEQQLQGQVAALRNALASALQKQGKDALKLAGKDQMRDIDVYKAETDRFKALADALMIDQGGIKSVVEQLVQESMQTNLQPILKANQDDLDSDGSPPEDQGPGTEGSAPAPGATKAPDGEWYLTDPTRPGKYLRVSPLAQQHGTRNILQNA